RAVHPPLVVPSDVHDLVMILLRVHDRLAGDLAVRRPPSGVLLDDPPHDLPVSIDSIHWWILALCSSKISRRNPSRETMSWPNFSVSNVSWIRRGAAR